MTPTYMSILSKLAVLCTHKIIILVMYMYLKYFGTSCMPDFNTMQ